MYPTGSLDFINYLRTESAINPLLTEKHHWDRPTYNWRKHKFRTIFYSFVGEGLEYILDASQFDVYRLDGMSNCYLFEPKMPETAVALGRPSGSISHPSASYNSVMIVSGSVAGWHGYPECYPEISRLISDGKITGLTLLE